MYHDKRLIEIWLTRAERDDPAIAKQLQPLYHKYAKRKYTVVVYQSGAEDLWDSTSALLVYNRDRLARLETQQEREQLMKLSIS